MSDVLVELRDVGLAFKERQLLRDVSLVIEAGQLLAILGPNGAGKSSMLKLLASEWTPTSGSIRFEDRELSDYTPNDLARRRAVLPQESHLAFPFSVREVIALGRLPHAAHSSKAEDTAVVDAMLETFDLLQLANRRYTQLSGGEKQRVQAARVAAQLANHPGSSPSLFLLDEPTNNLDPVHRFTLMDFAREQAKAGNAVVAVLHDLNLALAYANKVALMKDGQIAITGEPKEALNPDSIRKVLGVEAVETRSGDGDTPYIVLRGRADL